MKAAGVVTLLLVLGCGGDKDGAGSAKENEAPAVAPVPVEQAAPAAGATLDDQVGALRLAASNACACEDADCATAARAAYDGAREDLAPHQPNLSADQTKDYSKAARRWQECTLADAKTQMELRAAGQAVCECGTGDAGCLRRAADDIGDINKNVRVQAWLGKEFLEPFSVRAAKCLLSAGMSAADAEAQGVPAEFIARAAN